MNKRKILTYCIFIIAGLMVGATFVTARTYFQLAAGIFLYPLLAYFILKAFPRKAFRFYFSRQSVTAVIKFPVKSAEEVEAETIKPRKDSWGIADIDKRTFLKLIGGAGVALFLFSIFNRKAESPFFGKATTVSTAIPLQDAAGNKIDPAQSQPTDGYKISEIDDNIITFYGFTNKDDAWFIMREDTDTGSFRYTRGKSDFPGSWTNRKKLKYDYYSNVFRP